MILCLLQCIPTTPMSEAEELQLRMRAEEEKQEGMAESTPKPKAEDTEQGSAGLAKPQGDTTSLTQEVSVEQRLTPQFVFRLLSHMYA